MLSSVVCSLLLGIAGDRFSVAAAPSKPDAALLSKRGSKRTGEGKGALVTVKKEPGSAAGKSNDEAGARPSRAVKREEDDDPIEDADSAPKGVFTLFPCQFVNC